MLVGMSEKKALLTYRSDCLHTKSVKVPAIKHAGILSRPGLMDGLIMCTCFSVYLKRPNILRFISRGEEGEKDGE